MSITGIGTAKCLMKHTRALVPRWSSHPWINQAVWCHHDDVGLSFQFLPPLAFPGEQGGPKSALFFQASSPDSSCLGSIELLLVRNSGGLVSCHAAGAPLQLGLNLQLWRCSREGVRVWGRASGEGDGLHPSWAQKRLFSFLHQSGARSTGTSYRQHHLLYY